MTQIRVKKRNGKLEDFDIEKIHRIVGWAVEGINNVSMSDVEMNAELSLFDKITTKEIHDILIKSAANLISEDTPNYQYVAAKLLGFQLRKDVWGSNHYPRLIDHIKNGIKKKIYDPSILDKYTDEEINKIGTFIKHRRDDLFSYSGLQQLIDKYLLKNRHTGEIYETPQFMYMLIAMYLFAEYGENRLDYVKLAYEYFSLFKINLPTPIMSGVRTNKRQFASCVLADIDDNLDSIFANVHAIGKYTANRAGIGLNIGRIRPINSSIRNGEVIHTGLIPFLKVFESTVKSTSQNSIRGGSATVYIPIIHYEIEDIMVLKNNAGTDDNRVRKLDYCIQFSKIFYQRFINDEDITLLSPNECRDVFDAFGLPEFDKLYLEAEQNTKLKFRKKVKARKLAELFARERLETGRIYAMNIDNANINGSWNKKVTMSNLCTEIIHCTKPIQHIDDENGEIGICILSALNLLELKNDEEIESACDVVVRLLNELIDYQDYPVKAGETFTKNKRSLGVGITNLAALLAKNKLSYRDQEALELIDEYMEKIQYFLLKSSCKQAKEHGSCPDFSWTKYSEGLLPMDWCNKEAAKLVNRKPNMDWESLREDIKKYGLRNCTLSSIMPVESSSVVQNSTNGIEPVRSLISYKKAKNGTLKQVVPNFYKYRNYYDLAFHLGTNNEALIKVVATLQKWVDMGISSNHYYNYANYEDGAIPLSTIIKDLIVSYKYGLKTLYYCNTPDGDEDSASGCDGGACAI